MRSPRCPECGRDMILKTPWKGHAKGKKFYGCSGYPRCRGILSAAAVHAAPPELLDGSPQQQIVWQKTDQHQTHIMVRARAGTGKTTTIVQSMLRLPDYLKAAFSCFSNSIAEELQAKIGLKGRAFTLHSFGLSQIRKNLGNHITVNPQKIENILLELAPSDDDWGLRYCVERLVNLCKGYLLDGKDRDALEDLAFRHNVEPDDMDRAFDLVPLVLKLCSTRLDTVDFGDMCWLPIYFDLPLEQFDIFYVDEAQDMDPAQQKLVRNACQDGCIVFLGDDKQSLYGFRGADVESMDNMFAALEDTNKGCVELPLTVSRRLPKSGARLAQRLVNDITAMDDAIEGIIEEITPEKAAEDLEEGDMVLCRTNAPLIRLVYACLRRNPIPKVIVKGKKIGDYLLYLIWKMGAKNIDQLIDRIEDYRAEETAILEEKGRTGSALINLNDRCDTLIAMCEGMHSIDEVKKRIRSIFEDFEPEGKPKKAIIFSSIHRAKGLEADSVYILNPELIPHKLARQMWEKRQEVNCCYVAITRHKVCLKFVGKMPELLQGGLNDYLNLDEVA